MNWYFRIEKNEFDDLFPKIRLEEFKKLPIPKEKSRITELSNVTSKIMELKKLDKRSDTSFLESQIDQLVYEMYGLTEEEIRIVEGE